MEKPREGKKRSSGPSPWALTGLGVEIAAPIVLGVLGGHFLDGKLGTAPWLLIVGALLGAAVGFYGFFRAVLPSRRGRE